jgi:hypothetical protein
MYLTPINVEIIANVPAKALTKCNVGLSVLKKVKILFLGIKKKIGINPNSPLKKAISPIG